MAHLDYGLKQAFAGKDKKEFSLQADRGVNFGRVVAVMDKARLAGAQSIAVVTESKE